MQSLQSLTDNRRARLRPARLRGGRALPLPQLRVGGPPGTKFTGSTRILGRLRASKIIGVIIVEYRETGCQNDLGRPDRQNIGLTF